MLAAPNALIMTGGATTVIEALEVLPVPPSVEVTWTLLFFTPAVVPCTLTETVQLALAANVPPERLMLPDPATAVAVPPQVLFKRVGRCHHQSRRQVVSKCNSVQRNAGIWVLNGKGQRRGSVQRNAGRAKRLGDRWR